MASDDLCGCAVERLWQERGEAWEAENAKLEAAISSVRALAEGWASDPGWGEIFFNDAAAAILAALDSSGTVEDAPEEAAATRTPWQDCPVCGAWPCDEHYPDASAQLPEERSDEGQKKPMPPCPHCGPGYRYGDEGCRHMIPPSVSGLPVDGETT